MPVRLNQRLALLLAALLAVPPALAACSRRDPPGPPPVVSPSTATPPASPSAAPRSAPPSTAAPLPTRTGTSIPSALKGKDIERIPTTGKVVALTFDAGANADGLASIQATLAREGVPATFFLTGAFAERFPTAAAGLNGYRIGNHSMTHPHLTQLSDAQVRAQIRDAAARVKSVTGQDPKPYFRFPYGDRDARTIGIVNAEGYVAVRWTTDSLGWQGTAKHSAASVAARVIAGAQPGQIVLMHIGSNPDDKSTLDADALPAIVSGLRAKGYGFVTLDALIP